MESRLANTWQITVNEKKFIETALLSNLRIDGRPPDEYRELTIDFGCQWYTEEHLLSTSNGIINNHVWVTGPVSVSSPMMKDGSSEVQLGQTRVVGLVTAQLGQPYSDRPNEGSLYIYTEFSPMADPSFEAGRPGELAVELGRIIDRGLRESRAVDTESLCVIPGQLVWSLRVDLQILDNGGNLIDAANIAALAALLTFRRPDCTVGDGLEVTVHPPEVSEPVPLIVHHLPIAVTFALFSKINTMVVDPNRFEEALMEGRMTFTVNINGDICAIQKPGGVGLTKSIITECLQTSLKKATDITNIIQNAVDLHNSGRALGKLKLNPPDASLNDNLRISGEVQSFYEDQGLGSDMEKLTIPESCDTRSNHPEIEMPSTEQEGAARNHKAKISINGPFRWDPYPKGADSERLKVSLAAQGQGKFGEKQGKTSRKATVNFDINEPLGGSNQMPLPAERPETTKVELHTKTALSLKDAVKPKNMRRKKSSHDSAT